MIPQRPGMAAASAERGHDSSGSGGAPPAASSEAAPLQPRVPAGPTDPAADPGAATGPTRTAKGEQSREALEDAARELFGARGYVETTVRDIARAAGFSVSLFYAHFDSKEQAYRLVMGERVGALVQDEPAAAPTTLRGRRTRAALLTAAREVFEENGYLSTRVVDITQRAGVASGTFYTYFDSKEEVFREVIREVTAELFARTRVSAVADIDDPVERIRAANALYVESYVRYGRMLTLLDQVASLDPSFVGLRREVRQSFVDRAAAGIRRLQEQGVADRALDADTAASALAAMVGHFAHVWLDLGEPYDPDVAVETLTRLWARGIGLPLDSDVRRDDAAGST
jgi:AcrR family transcriptional regulator